MLEARCDTQGKRIKGALTLGFRALGVLSEEVPFGGQNCGDLSGDIGVDVVGT